MGFSRLNMAKVRSDKLGARNYPSRNAKGNAVEIKTVLELQENIKWSKIYDLNPHRRRHFDGY